MYPPTPAFAKAGAAPGTTGGVELGSRVASKGTRPQTLPTLPQASKATTLKATATTSRLPFARPQTPQTLPTLPKASKATTLTATTCPCHLGFKTAVCPASNPPNASNPPAGLQGNNSYSYYLPLPSVFQGVQDCRLPALKPPKPSRRPPRQQLLQLHAPAICFSGGSRQVCLASNPPNASAGFQGNNSYSYTVATTCPCLLTFANHPGNYLNMRASVSVFTGFLQTFNQKPVSQNISLDSTEKHRPWVSLSPCFIQYSSIFNIQY